MPQLTEAYRTGGGVEWSDYGIDLTEAQGAFNRPWLVDGFATEMLPAHPGHRRAPCRGPAGARRRCRLRRRLGRPSRSRAPTRQVRVDGFDIDEASVELANENARDAGVDDRVTFRLQDVADAEAGAYDLAVIIEAVHDMTQPVGVLGSIRRMLKPDGVLLVADEKTEDAFTAPGSETERFFYGFSILTCLPAAMTERPTAAIGTVIRADTMRRLGLEAGFSARRAPRRAGARDAPLLPDDAVAPIVAPSTDYDARVPDAAPAAVSDASLAEVMATMRAMRRLRPDPVPEALIDELIQAAMWAPTGSYQQGEVFVVVTDRARMARLAELWRDAVGMYEGWLAKADPRYGSDPKWMRTWDAIHYQRDHFAETPPSSSPVTTSGRTSSAPRVGVATSRPRSDGPACVAGRGSSATSRAPTSAPRRARSTPRSRTSCSPRERAGSRPT